jgi:CRISPR-associated protein Csb2
MHTLLFQVNLLNPLWHGTGDWPPSPFRLFQAMVAGAFGGRWAAEDEDAVGQRFEAFRWLERQPPPHISAPPRSECRHITSYVPNNDLDSVGGDPARVDEIRVEKVSSSTPDFPFVGLVLYPTLFTVSSFKSNYGAEQRNAAFSWRN